MNNIHELGKRGSMTYVVVYTDWQHEHRTNVVGPFSTHEQALEYRDTVGLAFQQHTDAGMDKAKVWKLVRP